MASLSFIMYFAVMPVGSSKINPIPNFSLSAAKQSSIKKQLIELKEILISYNFSPVQ